MVPRAGIEPARYFYRGILSPLRLPISPPGQFLQQEEGSIKAKWIIAKIIESILIIVIGAEEKMEAGVGIEPAYTELQSAA